MKQMIMPPKSIQPIRNGGMSSKKEKSAGRMPIKLCRNDGIEIH